MSNGYLNIESMLLKSAEDEKKIKGLLEFEVIIPRRPPSSSILCRANTINE